VYCGDIALLFAIHFVGFLALCREKMSLLEVILRLAVTKLAIKRKKKYSEANSSRLTGFAQGFYVSRQASSAFGRRW